MSVGYFGKLPQRADFVACGLPESFLAPFDHWLRQGGQHGQGARPSFWNFALSAGVAGPGAVVGVMTPSRDRSGREFPFIIACVVPSGIGVAFLAAEAASWQAWAGHAAGRAAAGVLSPGELDAALRRRAVPAFRTGAAVLREEDGWRIKGGGGLAVALPALLDTTAALRRASLWWNPDGCLLVEGLPRPSRFPG